jgi:murein DD-endopeptidase MepM/ murein hydrolase activator NlpD
MKGIIIALVKRIKNTFSKSFFKASAVVALFTVSIILVPTSNTQTVHAGLQDDLNTIQNQISDTKKKIGEKQGEAASLEKEVAIFDGQITQTELQIQQTETEIKLTTERITQTEEDLKIKRETLNEYLRVIYEESNTSALELVASSDSFSDFVDRSEYLQTMQIKIKDMVEKIKIMREELELKKKDLNKLSDQLNSQRTELNGKRAGRQSLLNQTRGEEAGYQEALKQEQSKKAQISSLIQSITLTGRTSQSGYAWPLAGYSSATLVPVSNYIPYGYSDYYFPGMFHTGIDIYGSGIMSASNGIVAFAGPNGGYGNCVVVENGSHLVYYGHMSSIAVSQGQSVNVGTHLGNVGSTGWSTGPHLHFEIRQGGSSVNPLNFLP